MSYLSNSGQEIFDQTPIINPLSISRPIPLHLRLREQILCAMEEMRSSSEYDTPEEADDFEMNDDSEMWEHTPYEVDFDHINESESEKNPSARNADILPHDDAEKNQPSDKSEFVDGDAT